MGINRTERQLSPLERKYGLDGVAFDILLFVIQINVQGRTKRIEDGIMDKRWR